jgi:integrase/recombinase XerC
MSRRAAAPSSASSSTTPADPGRHGVCEEAFGPGQHPVAICHEWNSIAHLNDYEGDPEARPFTREEMQRLVGYADEQVSIQWQRVSAGDWTAYAADLSR